MERPELMACVEEPVAEPDPRQEQQAEPVEAAMWAAMDGLARLSQASVIHRVGNQGLQHPTRMQEEDPCS
jgi:hypothetical protein